jgi:hypothetical protein
MRATDLMPSTVQFAFILVTFGELKCARLARNPKSGLAGDTRLARSPELPLTDDTRLARWGGRGRDPDGAEIERAALVRCGICLARGLCGHG